MAIEELSHVFRITFLSRIWTLDVEHYRVWTLFEVKDLFHFGFTEGFFLLSESCSEENFSEKTFSRIIHQLNFKIDWISTSVNAHGSSVSYRICSLMIPQWEPLTMVMFLRKLSVTFDNKSYLYIATEPRRAKYILRWAFLQGQSYFSLTTWEAES